MIARGGSTITYRAKFQFVDGGVHAELLDFPGVITCGKTLEEARQMLASALIDMAETNILLGLAIPKPDPACSDPEADLEEPLHLLLTASYRVAVVPVDSQGVIQ